MEQFKIKIADHATDLESGIYVNQEIDFKGGVIKCDLIINRHVESDEGTYWCAPDYRSTSTVDVMDCMISFDDETEQEIDDFTIKL